MGTHEDEVDLATGAQLYRMNELGILPATVQITKEEANEILSEARRNGTWPKERPQIGKPFGSGPLLRRSRTTS